MFGWTWVLVLSFLVLVAPVSTTTGAPAPPMVIQFMGISPAVKPLDKLECRQALAYSLNRAAISEAVKPMLRGAIPTPYSVIQPPGMEGHNPQLKGYDYDAGRAKELAARCEWGETIRIFVPTAPNDLVRTLNNSIAQSVTASLGVQVKLETLVTVDRLAAAVQRGDVSIYVFGEISSSGARGLPFFPLVVARYVQFSQEIQTVAEKGDAATVERILVENAFITGILWYRRT